MKIINKMLPGWKIILLIKYHKVYYSLNMLRYILAYVTCVVHIFVSPNVCIHKNPREECMEMQKIRVKMHQKIQFDAGVKVKF